MTIVNTSANVRKSRIAINSAALVDVLLIALMFTLLGSKYILAPGISVDLGNFELPQSQELDRAVVNDSVSVLNAKGNSMIIFDGTIYNANSFAKTVSKKKAARGTLLIKADKNVDAATLIDICSAARMGGFQKVQIASEPKQ